MGITNNIPPSRLIQPGVIDNAAARPASPFEGQCIFQKDTDQLLVWNGTAWVIPNQTTQNPSGLELIANATFSSTNDLIISDCFSSIYTNYKIIFEVDTSSTSVAVSWQFRNTSGNLSGSYYSAGSQADFANATVTKYSENNAASSLALVTYDTLDYGFCHLEVMRPNEAQYTMFNNTNMNYRPSTSLIEQRMYAGAYQQTTPCTGIHFFTGSVATFAGKYFIYGYRN